MQCPTPEYYQVETAYQDSHKIKQIKMMKKGSKNKTQAVDKYLLNNIKGNAQENMRQQFINISITESKVMR